MLKQPLSHKKTSSSAQGSECFAVVCLLLSPCSGKAIFYPTPLAFLFLPLSLLRATHVHRAVRTRVSCPLSKWRACCPVMPAARLPLPHVPSGVRPCPRPQWLHAPPGTPGCWASRQVSASVCSPSILGAAWGTQALAHYLGKR